MAKIKTKMEQNLEENIANFQNKLNQTKKIFDEYTNKDNLQYQLDQILEADFSIRSTFMWKGEFQIYEKLIFNDFIKTNFIIFPQISLYSISQNAPCGHLIVDFLLTKKDFKEKSTAPFAVLEFHGSGHYKDNEIKVRQNDKLKTEFFKKLNFPFFVLKGDKIYKDNTNYIDDEKLKNAIEEFCEFLKRYL